jgi:chromosome segregation ATPase
LESMIAVSNASHESDIATEMHDMHQQLTHARTQTAAAEDALQLALSECEERIAAAEATSASAASDAAKAMASAQQSFARELHQRVAHHAAQQAAMKQEHAVALAALRSQNDELQIELKAVKSELSTAHSQMALLHAESASLKDELSRVRLDSLMC